MLRLALFVTLLLAGCAQPVDPATPLTGWEVSFDGSRWDAYQPGQQPPGRQGRRSARFRVTLPGGEWADPSVFLEHVETSFTARLDGRELYRSAGLADLSSASWHLLPLPPGFAGKRLELEVSSLSPFALGPEGRIEIGSHADHLRAILATGLSGVTAGLLSLFLCLVLSAIYLGRREEPVYLAFAAFAASEGFVFIAVSDLKQLLWNEPRIWQYLLVLGRMGAAVALCAFVDRALPGQARWPGRLWRAALAFTALAFCALLFDYGAVYRVLWVPINVQLMTCYLAAVFLALRAALRGDAEARILCAGFAAYLVCTLHELLVGVQGLRGGQSWLVPGLLLVFAAMSTLLLRRFFEMHRTLQRHALALEQKNEQLQRAEQQLGKAVLARDEFLSVASHELRTPLTSLQLQTQLLARHAAPSPAVLLIQRQTQRLGLLIDQLLDVTRIRTDALELFPRPVDLVTLARELIGRLAEEAKLAGCEVTLSAPGSLRGDWDEVRVEQVLGNLLGNALKYGAGKPVRVEVGQRGAMAFVAVVDQGIGVPVEHQRRIFDRFERAVSSRSFPGLGLGLWVARVLAGEMGGHIGVVSSPGRGARFEVELPLPAAQDRAG